MTGSVVYPTGRDADLVGRCPPLGSGEAGWITKAPDAECALCSLGVCQQRLSYGIGQRGAIVFHTMAGMG